MSRCYGCAQENCGNKTVCSCGCHATEVLQMHPEPVARPIEPSPMCVCGHRRVHHLDNGLPVACVVRACSCAVFRDAAAMPVRPPADPWIKPDAVNHPAHYGGADDPYEVIKVAEAWGLDHDAYLFNTIKYVARAGKKDATKLVEDLEKALFYLKRRIASLKKET